MRWLDRVARRFGYVPKRSAAYAAGILTRLHEGWLPAIRAADAEIRQSLTLMRARSQQLYRDNPHAKGYVELVRRNIVGPKGIGFQSRVMQGDGSLRRSTNAAIEAGWSAWGRKGTCTADGRLSWRDVQLIAVTHLVVDGEFLLRRRRGYPNGFGFALQFLDPSQLDETYCLPASRDRGEIRMGVEVDGDGRPVAYHLWRDPVGDLNTARRERVRVPADEIIHGFIAERAGQTRGVPHLHAAMLTLDMLDGYEESELVAARSGADKPTYFEVIPEFADIWEPAKITELEKQLKLPSEPGMKVQLPVGLRANNVDPQHPNSAFQPFQKAMLRRVATGGGVSYNSLANDLEAVNYSSMRAGLLQERDGWMTGQQWLIENLCEPVFLGWLAMAVTSGAVRVPGYDVARWAAPTWQPRGWPWVDPLTDVQADVMAVALKTKTRTEICASQGRDFEEVLDQQAEEDRMIRERGLDPALPSGKASTSPQGGSQGGDQESGDGDTPANGNGNGRNGAGGHRLAALLKGEI